MCILSVLYIKKKRYLASIHPQTIVLLKKFKKKPKKQDKKKLHTHKMEKLMKLGNIQFAIAPAKKEEKVTILTFAHIIQFYIFFYKMLAMKTTILFFMFVNNKS